MAETEHPNRRVSQAPNSTPRASARRTSGTRTDAARNRNRLLAVAAEAFARDGDAATLKAIAAEAGVGIGTLYRHFPTREALVDAVYRTELDRLCDAAPQLLAELEPIDALREWCLRFLDFMATKAGMAGVLQALLTTDKSLRLDSRARVKDATRLLLAAAQRSGSLRADLELDDVTLALGGFALILQGREDARTTGSRLLDLLQAGLSRR